MAERLAESVEAVLDTLPHGVICQEADGRVREMNQAARRMLGAQWRESVAETGHSARALREDGSELPPDEHPSAVALRTGQEQRNVVMGVFVNDATEPRWLLVSSIPLAAVGSLPRRVYTFFEDVTQRKREEAELRDRRAQLASIAESLADGLVVARPDGTLADWNRVAREMIEARTEAQPVATVRDLGEHYELRTLEGAPLPLEQWPISRVLRGETLRDVVLRAQHRTLGYSRIFSYAGSLVRDANGAPTMAVVRFTDVTERTRLNEELGAAHAHLASLSRFPEENPGPVLRANGDLLLVYANASCRRAFSTLTLEVGSALPDELVEGARAALDAGALVHRELTCGELTTALAFVPVADEVFVYGHDVTPRKRVEVGLRRSEERLRLALEAVEAGTWERELATGASVWSEHIWSLMGLDRAVQPSQQAAMSAILPEDREAFLRSSRRAESQGLEIQGEYRVRARDGGVRWLQTRARPSRDDHGVITRYVGVVLDVTERKEAEELERQVERAEVVRQSEAKFRALIERASDLIVVADERRKVVLWSPGAQAATGWTELELRGRALSELFHADDYPAIERALARPVREGVAAPALTARVRHKQGGWRVLDVSARDLLSDPNVGGIVLNARDATERVRAEAEAHKAQKLEALGVLAGGIAHDFNNLLAAVFAHVDLALASLPPESDAAADLTIAAGALGQGRRLAHQLLTFARGGAPVREVCTVDALVRDAVAATLASSSVRCDVLVPPGIAPLDVDPAQITQVLGNLLANARDATTEGGVVSMRAQNRYVRGEGWVELRVIDSGAGIAPDVLPRVFDPFFSTRPGAVGLGLATAYSIATRHGGKLSVESEQGKGTTAILSLPASRASVRAAPMTSSPAPAARRVLLMDDEPAIRRGGAALMKRLGWEVETAADGEEALRMYGAALAASARFDVVIMDLTIPSGLGGAATIGRLLALDPEVKAIVCSGYSEDPVMASPVEHGFAAALAKPYTKQEIAETLDAVLAAE